MREWHLTPEYILEKMTDEEWEMYWRNRNHSVLENNRAIARLEDNSPPQPSTSGFRVKSTDLFKKMGIAPQPVGRA